MVEEDTEGLFYLVVCVGVSADFCLDSGLHLDEKKAFLNRKKRHRRWFRRSFLASVPLSLVHSAEARVVFY